ncbi:MAG: transcription repressor NadR [Clostridiales Family XIII bacterium]|jgi:transcriptional regulator of NAD metabolism|nr:transcription repressor NadR [Clostridiales Family XIII bacterium]
MNNSGAERRKKILEAISADDRPLSASALADSMGVSRQAIVGDVAILRASGHSIIATARGYMMERPCAGRYSGRVAVKHSRTRTRSELMAIVRAGGVVVDVTVTHPFYGDLTGSLNLATPQDVDEFITCIGGGRAGGGKTGGSNDNAEKGALLSDLTGGIHMHTISCESRDVFDAIVSELSRMGILLSNTV